MKIHKLRTEKVL